MNLHDRLNLTGGVLVTALPFVVFVILLMRRGRYLEIKHVALPGGGGRIGAGVDCFVAGAAVLPGVGAAAEDAGGLAVWGCRQEYLSAFYAGAVAVVLLAFAEGIVRWVGIAAMFVSLAFLYVTLLGLSCLASLV